MDNSLETKYQEYLNLPGDPTTRLRSIGYPCPALLSTVSIASFEDFKAVVNGSIAPHRQELAQLLKMCYRTYLKKADLLNLLRIGKTPLSETEIREACRILPLDAEDGILVDDFIQFLYA